VLIFFDQKTQINRKIYLFSQKKVFKSHLILVFYVKFDFFCAVFDFYVLILLNQAVVNSEF